jgi:hypothetical protein
MIFQCVICVFFSLFFIFVVLFCLRFLFSLFFLNQSVLPGIRDGRPHTIRAIFPERICGQTDGICFFFEPFISQPFQPSHTHTYVDENDSKVARVLVWMCRNKRRIPQVRELPQRVR